MFASGPSATAFGTGCRPEPVARSCGRAAVGAAPGCQPDRARLRPCLLRGAPPCRLPIAAWPAHHRLRPVAPGSGADRLRAFAAGRERGRAKPDPSALAWGVPTDRNRRSEPISEGNVPGERLDCRGPSSVRDPAHQRAIDAARPGRPWGVLVKRILIGAVRTYQAARAGRPSPCRFTPSCSQYAIDALETHGACRGSWLAARRLLRCRPHGGRGWDPVPERKAA